MRVSLSIYGGLVPAFGAPGHVVDSDTLADHDNQELHRLVSAATAATACATSPTAGDDQLRDARTYQITVETDSVTTLLEATDGRVPEAFAVLRDWLARH